MQEIAFGHYLGLSTVSSIIRETTKILWKILQPKVLQPPSMEEWMSIEKDFYERWNIPNCIGAIDGKHVNIQAPPNSGSEFFNYKKQHSIVLMAACDARYRFTLVNIGAAGGCHDSIVFSESSFGKAILKNQLNIPPPKVIQNTAELINHYFVADAAFPLHLNIVKPFPEQNLQLKQRIYNYRISRARRTIESAFGILAQRWRILRTNIIANDQTCNDIIMACIVLHNFILNMEASLEDNQKRYCARTMVDTELPDGSIRPALWRLEGDDLTPIRRVGSNNSSRASMAQRNTLMDYFVSEIGSLPWQEDKVLQGSIPQTFLSN